MISEEKRRRLAAALRYLGAERAEDRAAAAERIAEFMERAGLDWEEVLARASPPPPPGDPLPDTDWQPAKPIDGCPGSWRRRAGHIFIVRQLHVDGSRHLRDGCRQHGPWYATVDGALILWLERHRFYCEMDAQRAADALEEHPVWDGSLVA